jgi:two-component system, NtrC family, response regulator HydG
MTIAAPTKKKQPLIMIVEDGAAEREALARMLRTEDFDVLAARDANQAMTMIDRPVDLVITDLRMGGRTGLDLLRTWRIHRQDPPFLLVTAYGDVDTAVTAMKLGARDFLTKPLDPERLLEAVRSCLPRAEAAADDEPRFGADRLLGKSAEMKRVRDQIRRVAPTDSSVLILGESGTGKELVAEALHFHSARAKHPFVVVNMAAVPDALVESELFGHARGSFTGATTDRVGRFETADRGTLFIDEIGDFPPASQAKLLRVLETRVVQRVGSNDSIGVNVRLVAATSRDLRGMVRDRTFREDLYYRLNVVTIELPPLGERSEDVPQLIDYFVRAISKSLNRPPPPLDEALVDYLTGYAWPGNVRQLRNSLESMLVLHGDGTLTLDDMPHDLTVPGATPAVRREEGEPAAGSRLERLERSAILQALEQQGGNRTRAAEALGISVRTLQRRLKEWGVDG